MADSALRMVLLLSEIPEYPKKISVAELMERGIRLGKSFSVARRTVERDLRQLSEHFPIQFDARSKPGGWSFKKGERVVLPGLTDGEAVTLVMAERMLADLLPPGVRKEIAPLVRAAQAKMLVGKRRKASSWPDKIQILRNVPKRIAPDIDPELLNTLYSAVFNEVQVDVHYRKLGAVEAKLYRLNPLALVLREPVVYLVCTRENATNLMHWPIHRFVRARRTARASRIPDGFDLRAALDKGLMDYPVSGKPIRLKLCFHDANVGRFLLESPLAPDQTHDFRGESLHLSATVRNTLELRWWILAFGPRIEVVGRKSVRRDIGKRL